MPVLTFNADESVMREFTMKWGSKIFYLIVSVIVILINYFFLVEYIDENYSTTAGWAVFAIIMVFYSIFLLYILYYMLGSMGFYQFSSHVSLFSLK